MKNVEVSYKWIAKEFEVDLRSNQKMPMNAMLDKLRRNYGVHPPRRKVARARTLALSRMYEGHVSSYQRLRDYANILQQRNLEVFVRLKTELNEGDGTLKFQSLMVSYLAQKNRFCAGCQWFTGLDGCHLKGPYEEEEGGRERGSLLSAVSIDANNGIFPLAICICYIESAESWSWFLGLLWEWLDVGNSRGITFRTN